MKFEEFCHKEVSRYGNVKGGGAVGTKGGFLAGVSQGCPLDKCKCSEGYWLSIINPRDPKKKEVRGTKITFKNKKEMQKVIKGSGLLD